MNRRYNTQSKRLKEAENILDRLKQNDTLYDNISSQGSSILATLLDGNNDDAITKENLLKCSNQISFSIDELLNLDSKYYLNNPYIMNWVKTNNIDLSEYAPPCVEKIKGSNGQIYDNHVNDLYCCFAQLCKYKEHSDLLRKEAEEGIKEDRVKTEERSNNFFKNNKDFYYLNEEKLPKYNEITAEIKDIERQIRNAEKQIADQKEAIRKIQEEAKRQAEARGYPSYNNPWMRAFFGSFMGNYKEKLAKDKLKQMEKDFNLSEKREYLSHLKEEQKENDPKEYNSYFDDNYIMQRTIQKIKKKKISIVTSVNVRRGRWGKIHTEEHREKILQEYAEEPIDTKFLPCIPSPDEFGKFISKGNYYRSSCLMRNINSIRYIRIMSYGCIEPNDEYFYYLNQLNTSFNNIDNVFYVCGKKDGKDDYSFEEANYILHSLPDYIYYGNGDKSYMVLEPVGELYRFDPQIKQEYSERYEFAGINNQTVKTLVYDEKDLEKYYKDFKYKVKVTFKLSCSYMESEEDKDKILNASLSINEEAYVHLCTYYKNLILKNLITLKNLYEKNSKSSYYCEDFDPELNYEKFYNYVNSFNDETMNKKMCNSFVDFCLNELQPWCVKRAEALHLSTTDIRNAEEYTMLLSKRMRKNTGTLLLWYQSLISFDNTYYDYLQSEEIAKLTTSEMMVTRGYQTYSDDSFVNIKNCNYIDICDFNKLYKEKKLNPGDDIYIINEIKEQKNIITRVETVNIPDANSMVDSNGNLTKEKDRVYIDVTRLYLEYKLKDWCYGVDPEKIIIAKIL